MKPARRFTVLYHHKEAKRIWYWSSRYYWHYEIEPEPVFDWGSIVEAAMTHEEAKQVVKVYDRGVDEKQIVEMDL